MAMDNREIWQLIDSRNIGGIESHVLELSKGLVINGFRVRVIFLKNYGSHPLKSKLIKHNIPVMELDNPVTGIWRSIREYQPALLHTHGYKAGIVGRLAGKYTGVPVVSTYHSGDQGKGRLRLYTAIDHITGFLSHNITVSEEISNRLLCNNIYVPNFVEIPADNVCSRNSNVIALVGRLSYEKGPDLFCQLSELLPQATFHIYGDGPMRDQLEHEYGSRIKFFGMVDDMAERWRNIGLLCMPSRHEGMPMAALEAMAHKVPIVAFAVGALPELITHYKNGYLSNTKQIHSLAKNIAYHLRQTEENKNILKEDAQRTIEEQYTTNKGISKITSLYAEIL